MRSGRNAPRWRKRRDIQQTILLFGMKDDMSILKFAAADARYMASISAKEAAEQYLKRAEEIEAFVAKKEKK